MGAGTEIGIYLIQNLGSLFLGLMILRGMLHASRVNFYNPISQMVVRLTHPVLAPLRGVLPARGRLDWAVWILAVIIQVLILIGIAMLAGDTWALPNPFTLIAWGVIGVLGLLSNLYFFVLIAMIVVSWVAPGSRHPAMELIWQLSEPVMAPFRRLLPNMGGIDFSPILVFIGLNVLQIALRHLALSTGLPLGLVLGI